MTDALIGVGLSNLLLTAALGLLAFAVHRGGRYPALAHLLWVLTLAASVTPPLVTLSMPLPQVGAPAAAGAVLSSAGSLGEVSTGAEPPLAAWLPSVLIAVWLSGSLMMLAASARRIARFGRLLRRSCRMAPPGVQRLTESVAYELDLGTVPHVHVSAARLAPMTWWSGGRVRVVLPEALRHEVDDEQLRWILAHELAHIKRRDHLVRWLEWLCSVACWWNPVVWWARRNLRRDEEDACDALVLEHLQGQPRDYARTLLAVVEVMAAPGGRTPALATGIDAASSLEHRFTRIVAPGRGHRAPRALAGGLIAVALLLMSVGVATGEAALPVVRQDPGPPVTPASSLPASAVTPGTDGVPAAAALAPDVSSFASARNTLFVSAYVGDDGRYVGTYGPDSMTGTDADESFKGYGGNDTIGGGPGRDTIDGGEGADTIHGGDGADTLNGGPGGDSIGGGAGDDIINGGAGADVIQGGAGRDTVAAGAGDDIVRVWADGSPDVVDCGGGDDRAIIGSSDSTTGCETVVVRDPS